jgi:hypothetical protein
VIVSDLFIVSVCDQCNDAVATATLLTPLPLLRSHFAGYQADRKASKAKVEAHHNKKRAMQAETKHTRYAHYFHILVFEVLVSSMY